MIYSLCFATLTVGGTRIEIFHYHNGFSEENRASSVFFFVSVAKLISIMQSCALLARENPPFNAVDNTVIVVFFCFWDYIFQFYLFAIPATLSEPMFDWIVYCWVFPPTLAPLDGWWFFPVENVMTGVSWYKTYTGFQSLPPWPAPSHRQIQQSRGSTNKFRAWGWKIGTCLN